jgi:hypothetical protein
MAKTRINFGISEELVAWIQSQPNIDGLEIGQNYVIVVHHMTGPQAAALKSAFIDRLIEAVS